MELQLGLCNKTPDIVVQGIHIKRVLRLNVVDDENLQLATPESVIWKEAVLLGQLFYTITLSCFIKVLIDWLELWLVMLWTNLTSLMTSDCLEYFFLLATDARGLQLILHLFNIKELTTWKKLATISKLLVAYNMSTMFFFSFFIRLKVTMLIFLICVFKKYWD